MNVTSVRGASLPRRHLERSSPLMSKRAAARSFSTSRALSNASKTDGRRSDALGISDTALADDAEITVDITRVQGTAGASGLKVTLIGNR